MPNVLISSEIGSVVNYLGHPQLFECMGICVLSLTHGSELRGSKGGLCLDFFLDFSFEKFGGGGVRGKSFRLYYRNV